MHDAVEDLLADPLTQAAMAADRISAEEMRELLRLAWMAVQARKPPAGELARD